MEKDFENAIRWIQAHALATGRAGCVGFCFGGKMAHLMAVRIPDLAAAVPFYGTAPAPEEAGKVRAPLLVHLASLDERVNEPWPPYEAALKGAGKEDLVHVYEGANHGFHNDSTPRYDEAAAKLAWERTLEFLARHLKKS